MTSELGAHLIYGYCKQHQVPMKYIGRTILGRPVVQCPRCLEKWVVPESWVRGLEPCGEMGKSLTENKEEKDKAFQKRMAKESHRVPSKKMPLRKVT